MLQMLHLGAPAPPRAETEDEGDPCPTSMGSNTSHLCWALSPRPVWVEGVSGDKRRRWLPPTWTESGSLLCASLSGKGGTALPSQPVAMVHMIPQPRGRGLFLGGGPNIVSNFHRTPHPHPSRSEVRDTSGLLTWVREATWRTPTLPRPTTSVVSLEVSRQQTTQYSWPSACACRTPTHHPGP